MNWLHFVFSFLMVVSGFFASSALATLGVYILGGNSNDRISVLKAASQSDLQKALFEGESVTISIESVNTRPFLERILNITINEELPSGCKIQDGDEIYVFFGAFFRKNRRTRPMFYGGVTRANGEMDCSSFPEIVRIIIPESMENEMLEGGGEEVEMVSYVYYVGKEEVVVRRVPGFYESHPTGHCSVLFGFTLPYTPESNGMLEAFVATMKRDYIYTSDCNSAHRVMKSFKNWIEDYNNVAPHSGLGMKSPVEYRKLRNQAV